MVCRYCGKLVFDDVRFKNQKVHTRCAMEQPPNFIFELGTFHLELRTELMSNKQLQKMLKKLPKG